MYVVGGHVAQVVEEGGAGKEDRIVRVRRQNPCQTQCTVSQTQSAVDRILRTQDSQSQTLALAFRSKSVKLFKVFPLARQQNCKNKTLCCATTHCSRDDSAL